MTQLAAILFSDIAGYTALMERDEAGAIALLEQFRGVYARLLADHQGWMIKDLGDGHLCIFDNVEQAVRCAAALQRIVRVDPKVPLRMGLHIGEVAFIGQDVFGSAVNIASRIESFSVPGAVLVSSMVYETLKSNRSFSFQSLGRFVLKNVDEPMELFALSEEGLVAPEVSDLAGKGRPAQVLHHLPQYLTSFVGREQEIGEIKAMIREHRLVTVLGPGGTGKSRLAARVAEEVTDRFPDGVYWVELAPVADPDLVAFAIAKSLGLNQDPLRSMEETITAFLQEKDVLLLLDNFEQIIDAAPLVEHLLLACPMLHILVTSRVLLQLMGEREYPAPPLPLPLLNGRLEVEELARNPAVQLFCERAQASRLHFALTSENGRTVAEICIRLDGLPLAIELAAARVKLFTPQKMLARLENRLAELKGGSRSLPDRHRTIRNAIQWSYDLLEGDEQELFRRMSVFVGGCKVEAAEEVCGRNGLGGFDVVDGVLALVDKSLLRSMETEEPRFFMLETIREFSREALRTSQKETTYQAAHADYFLALAESAVPHLSGPDQSEWMARLDQEQDNFRAAIDFAIQSGDYGKAYRLGSALRPFWGNRGRIREAEKQLERLRQLPVRPELKKLQLKILQDLGMVYFYVPQFPKAAPLFEETLTFWESEQNKPEIAKTLNNLGWTVMHLGQHRKAIDYSERALAIGRELGNKHLEISALNNMGWVKMVQNRPLEAEHFFQQTIVLTEAIGDDRRNGYARFNLARVNRSLGNYQTGVDLLEEALIIHQRNKDLVLTGMSYAELSVLQAAMGNFAVAETYYEEAARCAREMGSAIFIIDHANEGRCITALGKNDPEMAAALILPIKAINDQIVAHYRNVRNNILLGQIAFLCGQWEDARRYCRQTLELDRDRDSYVGILSGLELAAHLFAREGSWEKTALLLGKTADIRREVHAQPYPHERRWLERTRAEGERTLGVQLWESKMESGRQSDMNEAIEMAFTL